MTDRAERPERRSVPLHGGECVLDPAAGVVRVRRSALRYYHPLWWLFGTASALGLVATLATGWRYTAGTGATLGWRHFLATTALALAVPVWGHLRERLAGYTTADEVPLDAVEGARLTSTEIRWYAKTRRTVPVLSIRYRTDGAVRRRRVELPPRDRRRAAQTAVQTFEDAGVAVDVDADVAERFLGGGP